VRRYPQPVKLTRRATPTSSVAVEPEPEQVPAGVKGRPTPKRRDSQGQRGPVSAPRTRKEAYARQKQLTREQKAARATAKPRSLAEQRAALRRGDESALPRRDQGTTRKLARDYVDSHRMLSNYLLLLFPFMILGLVVPALQVVVLVAFLLLLVEWYITGRRITALAAQRYGAGTNKQGGALTIGFYSGSRAYLPRRWRMPPPQVQRGDTI
jgi:Protein of unknown function (DUF3043)